MARESPVASADAALGAAYAVAGAPDRAVDMLERAWQLEPRVPDIQSDLSAAYLERGVRSNRAEDFVFSLNFSERAVRADPALTEAWFNRALAVERLNLGVQAVQAWDDYFAHDHDSSWMPEARQRRSAADAGTRTPRMAWETYRDRIMGSLDADVFAEGVAGFPQEARELFERTALPEWADAYVDGDRDRAQTRMRRVRLLAALLEKTTGDRFAGDAVSALDSCLTRVPCGATAAIGLRAFRSGRDAYDHRAMAAAEVEFVRARMALETARNPLAYWTTFYAAGCAFYAKRLPEAVALAQRLVPVARARGYLALEARAEWLLGVVPVMQSDFDGGVPHYLASIKLFETTKEVGNQVAMLARLGQAYHDVGALTTAWAYQAQAFQIADRSNDRMAVQSLLLASVNLCLASDLPEAGLHFQHAAVENAKHLPAAQRAESAIQLARILSKLGRLADAQLELTRAGAVLREAGYQDPARQAEFLLVAGTSAERPAQSLSSLREAVDLFGQAGLVARLPEAYLQLGRAAAALRDDGLAVSSWLKGLDEFERQRLTVSDRTARTLQSANAAELVDEIARSYVSSGHEWDALRIVERMRARTLVDDLRHGSAGPALDLDALPRTLPADTVILYYASLGDRLLIWAVNRDARLFAQRPVTRERLTALVSTFSFGLGSAGNAGGGARQDVSSALYDEIVRPVERLIGSADTIVIVPAEPLQLVPFAALFDARTGKYLVERASILVTPSLTVFDHASRRLASRSARAPQSILVVGNPSAAPGRGAPHASLPGAELEARTVAGQYRHSELLIGETATKHAFLSAVAAADVVHFGGHAIGSAGAPELSRLLFAGTGAAGVSDALDLNAVEIAQQQWQRPRIVALAACQTAVGRSIRGEGLFSLARAFLFAGIPAVAASLSDADDEATQKLFVIFHEQLARGTPPEQALRLAQLAALRVSGRSADARWRWAPFIVIGGLANLQTGS